VTDPACNVAGLPAPGDSERRLRFLLRLSDTLRALESANEIQSTVSRMLADELGADRVGYADLLAGDAFIVVQNDTTNGMVSLKGTYPPADIRTQLCDRLCSGEIDVHADVAADPSLSPAEKAVYAEMRIGATVNVPLFAAGEVSAFFFLHYRQAHAFERLEIAVLREAAERAWSAIEGARIKAALRASEARLAAALESVPVGIAMLDIDGRIVLANSEYRQFLPHGIMPSRDPIACAQWQAWDDHGQTLTLDQYPGARAARGERAVPGQEMLFTKEDGHQAWTRVASVPIHDSAGRVTGLASVISDIDSLKRGSEALRESQARADLLINGIARATWEAAADGLVETDSPSWRAYTGQSYDDWKGYGWLGAIHPDDRESTLHKWRNTVHDQRGVDAEYRLRGADGLYRWMNVRAVPLRGNDGRVLKWLGMNIDIDDRKQAQDRQGVMVAELQHRTRNLIAVVRALAEQTLDRASSLADFETRFNGRLCALARAQGLLSYATAGKKVTFDELLQSELRALGAVDENGIDQRITLSGRRGVPLRSAAVQTFALALHELATNAVKHGALAIPTGRLRISWSVAEHDGRCSRLSVDWKESGVDLPAVRDEDRRVGYGRELIERALPYQLKAGTTYVFTEDGIHCTIDVPITSNQAASEEA